MHIEIEAKIKVDELETYARRAQKLGDANQRETIQRDFFFDRPDRQLLTAGCGLRLRQETASGGAQTNILCFKGPPGKDNKLKQRQEIEMPVTDAQQAQNLLEALGYQLFLTFEKRRRVWELAGCEICLDHVAELGEYIEIEGPSEDAIDQAAIAMGLEGYAHIHCSYAKLLTEQLQQQEGPNHRREVLLDRSALDMNI